MRPGMYGGQHQHQHPGAGMPGQAPMMFMPPGMMMPQQMQQQQHYPHPAMMQAMMAQQQGAMQPGMMQGQRGVPGGSLMPPQGYPGQHSGGLQAPAGHLHAPQPGGAAPNGGGANNNNNNRRQPRAAGADGQPGPRNNEVGEPTRVIHLRNVTPEVSQLSIQNLCQSFGRIRSLVMLRQKNQALVEMETLQAATQIVEYFKEPGYSEIDGRRVYMRYSRHEELTATQPASKTLLVSMFNTQYDVSSAAHITPMIVYQIFGNYGPVERIVVLPKNDSSAQNYNRVQALVQFETKEGAEQVKNMLQGQPVTLGDTVTFTLDIQFSRMEEIKTSSPHNSLVVPKGAGGAAAAPVPGGAPPQPPAAPAAAAAPGASATAPAPGAAPSEGQAAQGQWQ